MQVDTQDISELLGPLVGSCFVRVYVVSCSCGVVVVVVIAWVLHTMFMPRSWFRAAAHNLLGKLKSTRAGRSLCADCKSPAKMSDEAAAKRAEQPEPAAGISIESFDFKPVEFMDEQGGEMPHR